MIDYGPLTGTHQSRSAGHWYVSASHVNRAANVIKFLKRKEVLAIVAVVSVGWATLLTVPTPPPQMKPAEWANYEHPKFSPDDCRELSMKQAQEILDVDNDLLLTDMLHLPSKAGEIVYSECVFSDPADHEQQVTYSRFRLVEEVEGGRGAYPSTKELIQLERKRQTGTPYSEKYPGFGTRTAKDEDGHQSAWWVCGNQAITLAIRAKTNPSPDLSAELWRQLEPIIEQKCGTATNPTDILATDDYVRIDDVWQTSLKKNFDSPTLSSTRMDGTHKNGIARPDEDVPNYLHRRDGMGSCPLISETAGYLTGNYKTKWRSNGWYYGERGGRGTRGTYCAIYPSQDGETRSYRKGLKDDSFIYLSFEPQLPYSEDKSLLAADLAAEAHANESRRAPYARDYHGFGAIRHRLDEPKRSVQWLCRNYLLTIDFTTRFSNRELTNAEMWEVAEPAVNYFCKPINLPTKLAGDNHQFRIDYTKKLMKDWKMWSDNPRSGEPYNKSYVDPHEQYRRR